MSGASTNAHSTWYHPFETCTCMREHGREPAWVGYRLGGDSTLESYVCVRVYTGYVAFDV